MNEQWFLLGDIHGSAQPVHYFYQENKELSLIHISEPTRQAEISYAVFCLKKKKKYQMLLEKKKKNGNTTN